MKTIAYSKLLTIGVLSTGTLVVAPRAEAFSLSNGNVIGITNQDTGKSFNVVFDQGRGDYADDLNATAKFTLDSFSSGLAKFTIDLKNTSTVQSTLRALGFNTNPLVESVSSTGLFAGSNAGSNNFPTGIGERDVCFFTTPGTCTGANPGDGLETGEVGSLFAELSFAPTTTSFDITDFAVRFQEVGPNREGSGAATGTAIPTPALLPGLIGMGVAALRKKQKGENAV